MPTVGIRELKARLSAYIRHVRAGRVVFVTDHGEIVAELRPPEGMAASVAARRWDDAVAAGWLRPPADPEDRSWLEGTPGELPPGTATELLDAERGER